MKALQDKLDLYTTMAPVTMAPVTMAPVDPSFYTMERTKRGCKNWKTIDTKFIKNKSLDQCAVLCRDASFCVEFYHSEGYEPTCLLAATGCGDKWHTAYTRYSMDGRNHGRGSGSKAPVTASMAPTSIFSLHAEKKGCPNWDTLNKAKKLRWVTKTTKEKCGTACMSVTWCVEFYFKNAGASNCMLAGENCGDGNNWQYSRYLMNGRSHGRVPYTNAPVTAALPNKGIAESDCDPTMTFGGDFSWIDGKGIVDSYCSYSSMTDRLKPEETCQQLSSNFRVATLAEVEASADSMDKMLLMICAADNMLRHPANGPLLRTGDILNGCNGFLCAAPETMIVGKKCGVQGEMQALGVADNAAACLEMCINMIPQTNAVIKTNWLDKPSDNACCESSCSEAGCLCNIKLEGTESGGFFFGPVTLVDASASYSAKLQSPETKVTTAAPVTQAPVTSAPVTAAPSPTPQYVLEGKIGCKNWETAGVRWEYGRGKSAGASVADCYDGCEKWGRCVSFFHRIENGKGQCMFTHGNCEDKGHWKWKKYKMLQRVKR